jgi:head-tail adaptor
VIIRLWSDTANAGFGIDQSIDVGVTRWAKVDPISGSSMWGAAQISEGVTHQICIRYGSGEITGQHVIDWPLRNKRFRVVRVTNSGDSDIMIMVECKELGAIT